MSRRLKRQAKAILRSSTDRWSLRDLRNRRPIIIHQMGKVGSSSVHQTLQELDLGRPLLQVHVLEPTRLGTARQAAREAGPMPRHLQVSSELSREFRDGMFPCDVITLVREPVSRAISFAFEDWKRKAPGAREGGTLDPEVMRAIVQEILGGAGGHADPGVWFEKELRAVFGIDVFSEPFDHAAGCANFENGPVRVLLLRLEDLDSQGPAILSRFLALDPPMETIRRANVGRKKWYADSLRRVKDAFRLDPGSLDRVYGTRFARHFYGPDLVRLRERWQTPDT